MKKEQREGYKDYWKDLDTELKRLDKEKAVTENTKNLIRKFVDEFKTNGRSPAYIYSEASRIKTLFRYLKKDFKKVTEKDLRNLFFKMEEEGVVVNGSKLKDSPKSMLSYKKVARMFWKRFKPTRPTVQNRYGFPKEVKWIDISMAKKKVKEQPIEAPLSEEEVFRLLLHASKRPYSYWIRDRAFIFVHYESMCRIGEDIVLKWRDIEFKKNRKGKIISATITIPIDKTGSRQVVITESLPDLLKWKRKHPEGNNPNAFVWRNMASNSNGKFMSYTKTCFLLKSIMKDAQLEKNVHTHLFRGSRCTHLLLRNVPTDIVRRQGGWTEGSSEFYRYVKFVQKDIENALISLAGIKNNEENDYPFKLKECLDCDALNSCLDDICYECTFPLQEKRIKDFAKKKGFIKAHTDQELLEMRIKRLELEIDEMIKSNGGSVVGIPNIAGMIDTLQQLKDQKESKRTMELIGNL